MTKSKLFKAVIFILTLPRLTDLLYLFCGYDLLFIFVFAMLLCLFLRACGHLLGKGLSLGPLVCGVSFCFVTFPYNVLGQVWYLIELIPDFFFFLTFKAIEIQYAKTNLTLVLLFYNLNKHTASKTQQIF